MGSLLAKLAISMLVKLITEKFMSRLLVEGMRAWSKQTENPFDDRVTEAVADAFGVEKEVLTKSK